MPLEVTVDWSGTGITGLGTSVFHGRTDGVATTSAAAQSLADRVRQFFFDIRGVMAPGITWTFRNEVLELDTSTGVLLSAVPVTPPITLSSTGSAANYSRAVGARVDWNTSAVVNGRRLKGRTYLVPVSGGNLDTTGTLASSCITAVQTAAAAYCNTGVFTSARPGVWSRTHGILADALAGTVDDRTSVLRSRRD